MVSLPSEIRVTTLPPTDMEGPSAELELTTEDLVDEESASQLDLGLLSAGHLPTPTIDLFALQIASRAKELVSPAACRIISSDPLGEGESGPSLGEILADYLEQSPQEFKDLILAFIAMYDDLERAHNLTPLRWLEIKGYIARQLITALSSGSLGPNNLGLYTKGFTRHQVSDMVDSQVEANKGPLLDKEIAKLTARRVLNEGIIDFDTAIHFDTNLLVEEAYKREQSERVEAYPKWHPAGLWRRFTLPSRARAAIDREHDGPDSFGQNFLRKIAEAFEKDLAAHILINGGTGQKWEHLSALSPILATHIKDHYYDIDHRLNERLLMDRQYLTIWGEEKNKLGQKIRAEITAMLKKLAVELFEGEIIVFAQNPVHLKSNLENLLRDPNAARIFCIDPNEMTCFK